jgi:uncharacterized protein YbjT (DUF2867 family)
MRVPEVPTVLVTGATRAVGRYVIPELQKRGFKVRGQYSRKPGTALCVEWRRMNFLETLDFHPLVEGYDAVVHLVAELNDVSRMARLNVEVTSKKTSCCGPIGGRALFWACQFHCG